MPQRFDALRFAVRDAWKRRYKRIEIVKLHHFAPWCLRGEIFRAVRYLLDALNSAAAQRLRGVSHFAALQAIGPSQGWWTRSRNDIRHREPTSGPLHSVRTAPSRVALYFDHATIRAR
ncbi:MAG: hypothetical protein R3C56_26040 [Pirellulaceae bacterium]